MNNKIYIYKKLKLKELKQNNYYKFYKKDKESFEAIFDSIIRDTLIVRNYNTEENSIRTMPKEWIDYIESEEHKIKVNNFID